MKIRREVKKVMTVLGTRPEVIKLFPAIEEINKSQHLKNIILSTNQQNALLESALREFNIKPDISKKAVKGRNLNKSLEGFLNVTQYAINKYQPNFVLIQGDTTSAFAGAMSGFLNNIPVVHLEAGLRTWEMARPFPEEVFRQAISRFTSINLAPNELAKRNLINEGIPINRIHVIGNTIVDSLKLQITEIKKRTAYSEQVDLLVTLHRRENFGKNLEGICSGVKMFAKLNKHAQIKVIAHSNPKARLPLQNILTNIENLKIIEASSRKEFLKLLLNCKLVLTDSGGVQEEAFLLGKRLLIAREETERPEVLETNSEFVDLDELSVFEKLCKSFEEERENTSKKNKLNLKTKLGDGKSARKLVEILEKYA